MSARPPREVREYVAGRLFASVATTLVAVAVVRVLDKPRAATLFGLLMLYETVSVLVLTGLPATTLVQVSGQPPERQADTTRAAFSLGLRLASFAALLVGGLALAGVGLEAGSTTAERLVYAAGLACFTLGDVVGQLLPEWFVGVGRARSGSTFTAARSVAFLAAVVLPAAVAQSLQAVVSTLAAVGLAEGLTAAVVVGRFLRAHSAPKAARQRVSRLTLLRAAIPLGATQVVQMLNQQLDRWLVWLAFSAEIFAEYRTGAVQVPIVTTFAYAFGTLALPAMREAFQRKDPRAAAQAWRWAVVHTAAWVFPITLVAVVAARDVVALLFTAEYDGATEVFRWYAVLTLGRIAWYAAPMLAAGEPQRVLRASWISLVVNAALSATFMLLLGAVGTAVGTAVAFLPTAFVYCSQGAKALGIRPTELFPTRAVATLLARGALAAAAAAAVRTLWPLSPGPALATSAAVLFVVWWALGLVRHPAASST